MRNSKFLQFLSKMSKGELIFEDNKASARTSEMLVLPCGGLSAAAAAAAAVAAATWGLLAVAGNVCVGCCAC
jgi:hypothetical protein